MSYWASKCGVAEVCVKELEGVNDEEYTRFQEDSEGIPFLRKGRSSCRKICYRLC
jgi:hypothetical protein